MASFGSSKSNFNNQDKFFYLLSISVLLLAPLSDALPLHGLFIAKYTEKHLQYIWKIILDTKDLVLPKNPCKRLLKTKFPDIYYKKSHMDYYHFSQ